MSNRQFFNNFLKKDELFHITQNNSIFKRRYWGPRIVNSIIANLTDAAGNVLNPANDYAANIQFYPNQVPAIPAKLVRIPAGEGTPRYNIKQGKIIAGESDDTIFKYVQENIGIRPQVAEVLPNSLAPVAMAVYNTRVRRNVKAMIADGRFELSDIVYKLPGRSNSDYWHPDYQGNFEFATSNSAQPTTPTYQSNFIPKNYLNDKQKESFLWLTFSPVLNAM